MQVGGVFIQSYITIFQDSPVDRTNIKRKACPQFEKFLYSLKISPDVMPEKKNTPSTENINRTNISSKNTLASAPTDRVIVDINAYKPSFLPASLIMRVTLRTLIILAICGPTDKAEFFELDVHVRIMSTKLDKTIRQSNLFQDVSKYLQE
jgi:hypothetical protein